MITNIKALNDNSILESNNLIEFSKSFVFKNKFTADNNETKLSLTESSYYIRAATNPLSTISNNTPAHITSSLVGNTNIDIINLYVKNTYSYILVDKISSITNQEHINNYIKNKSQDNIYNNNYFAEYNYYYKKLFISYYSKIVNKYGDIEESYDYNINIIQNEYPIELENLLFYIFNCRIYNHLDILDYDSSFSNIKIDFFLSRYHINKTYFLKTIYTEGFEIQENYFNFCKFFVVLMTIQHYVNNKTEIVFDIELLDDYSIRNLLYSYGIYFLDDLSIYSQRRVIRNIQRLLNNKGNSQVIANILDIFELPDSTVFKHYMEKNYRNGVVENVNFIGIPYNEHNYLKYIDSGKEKSVKPYNYFIHSDKSWKTSEEDILEPTNNIDFDYIETKYLSIESSFELQTYAAECAYFFDTVYRSKEYVNSIFTKSKIVTKYSNNGFDIFDGIIALATLTILINGSEPIIFKSNFTNNRYAFKDNLNDFELSNLAINSGINISKYFIMNSAEILSETLQKINNNEVFREKYNNLILDENNYTKYIELFKYYAIDDIKDKDIETIVNNVNSNLTFRKNLEKTVVNSNNYLDYVKLKEEYVKLFNANTNRSFFTQHDNYMDYLKDNSIDLYNLISPVYKNRFDKDILKVFNILVQDIKDFLNINSLILDTPYKENIFKHLYYTIEYFKSYIVQLTDFRIIFRFNNELENRLFIMDKDPDLTIYSKIADLVGGEMYEFQDRPLSLSDSFYENSISYRDINNTIEVKDTLRIKIRDEIKITVL